MKAAVLIPSYRRPADLARCLAALTEQTRSPDLVLVVVRVGDEETAALVPAWLNHLPIDLVKVTAPGVVHAMNAGLARCAADIVAITDDDAAPRADWLARIEAHFAADPKRGGVGGRDWIQQNGGAETGRKTLVGRVLWFGRIVGNHHLGVGPPREVDILKGVNCAFRTAALAPIGFDTRLRGAGAQVHWELCLCFAVKRAGWRLVYDPAIVVDHFPARRFDRDGRNAFNSAATADRAFNFRLALSTINPAWRRAAAFLWHDLIGTRDEPGLVNLLRFLLKREPYAWARYRAAHGISRERS